MNIPKYLSKSLLRQRKVKSQTSGFTLIELLVAMIVAVLVITPLMTLVLSLMNTDRREQAKTNSQQETQAALNYIAQDLQQAVYIYDAGGLTAIKDQIPPLASAPGCQSTTNCAPVLVFWKRQYLDREQTRDGIKISTITDSENGSDRFVYSLVAYYLIKDSDPTWSQVARIGRFEVRDGVVDFENTTGSKTRTPDDGSKYFILPDDGFARFDALSSDGIRKAAEEWKKYNQTYKQQVVTLVDFVDDTLLTNFPSSIASSFAPPANGGASTNNPNITVTASGCTAATGIDSSRVPPDGLLPASLNTGSFYACVNSLNDQGQSVAQIYLRGNALARINTNPKAWAVADGNLNDQLNYRPISKLRVAARSSSNN
jgi:prepilin-type N-terminal cleavage/methylation domain-containing protein